MEKRMIILSERMSRFIIYRLVYHYFIEDYKYKLAAFAGREIDLSEYKKISPNLDGGMFAIGTCKMTDGFYSIKSGEFTVSDRFMNQLYGLSRNQVIKKINEILMDQPSVNRQMVLFQ